MSNGMKTEPMDPHRACTNDPQETDQSRPARDTLAAVTLSSSSRPTCSAETQDSKPLPTLLNSHMSTQDAIWTRSSISAHGWFSLSGCRMGRPHRHWEMANSVFLLQGRSPMRPRGHGLGETTGSSQGPPPGPPPPPEAAAGRLRVFVSALEGHLK